MAVIAGLSFPNEITSIDSTPLPVKDRFPFPATAWGFAIEVENAIGPILGIGPPYLTTGALSPESSRLEPTIGQIWPR